MNKLTKNKIFFNLEKIIALTTVVSLVFLTLFCMTSCNSSGKIYYEKFHKNYCDNCGTFKNKISKWDI